MEEQLLREMKFLQIPASRMDMLVNRAGFIDEEVMNALLEMALVTQVQAITSQDTSEGVPKENPHASTMVIRLRDFTRVKPPV